MPKKTRKELKDERLKSNLDGSSSDDDGVSDVSTTSDSTRLASMEELSSKFSDAIEWLTEKASARRLEGLNTMIKIMKMRYVADLLGGKLESAVNGAIQCCAKGSSEECVAAFKVFALISVTVGGCVNENDRRHLFSSKSLNDAMFGQQAMLSEENSQRMKEMLIRNADAASKKSQEVRSEALFSLGILEFMDSSPEDLILEKENNRLQYFKQFWNDKDDSVVSAAIESWAFLATLVPNKYKVSMLVPDSLKSLQKIIVSDSTSPSLKISAGQAVALLFGAINTNEDYDSSISKSDYESLVEAMNKAASLSGKAVSKKEKAMQRMNFRSFVTTVEDGEIPSDKLNVSGNTLVFESWDKLIELANFKKLLEGGLLEHFKYNTNLQHIFDVDHLNLGVEQPSTKLSSLEKKYYLSKNSDFNKSDTLEKNKMTRTFANYVHATGYDEE
ncbi:hypothetical protein FDP41_009521 [Naegleria fowleri]|uniref:Interferon-related developmental regulator N-terminal domain-containing protein n=1 Tax=Naegleria fowleri TaxID=5763 RepID=A0A6A5AWB9_NAEFO|nr:uncharacterized protein FDP41_009521 [Naegleria fowleri]KAF0972213.1 hypothetical protein FDP41_009521 [Naegleria fowleri]CAG4714947.1 unnamed protein product [Naegleria fowleri]